MGTAYGTDILVWAREQAVLLRSSQLSALDIVQFIRIGH